jgi:hypothetical protein
MFSPSLLDNSFISSDEGVDGQGLEAARPASFSLTGDAATHSPLPGGANLEAGARNHDICSAPVALCKRSLRNGMTLTLREATDSDVVLQVEALEQARAEGRLYFRRSSWIALSDGPNDTARWARHRPQDSNRYRLTARLLVNPPGHRSLWSSPRSSDAGRISIECIECNDILFRLWSIDVTDYRLK